MVSWQSIKGWLFFCCWCLAAGLSLLLALVSSSRMGTIASVAMCGLAVVNGHITLLRIGVIGPKP